MSRVTQSRKEASHDRILKAASRAIRRNGYAGTGVADVMREAGLTHGGFYAHFASRDALLAAAADVAGAESIGTLQQFACRESHGEGLRSLLQAYLSRAHADCPETGCPVAALGSEMPRQAPEVRQAATRRIKEMINLVSAHSSGDAAKAMATTATMVGALIISRAVDDRELSDAILSAALEHLLVE